MVPYIGIYTKDVTFIEDGNNSLINGGINMEKVSLLGNVLREINNLQQRSYSSRIVPDVGILRLLAALPRHPDEEIERLSKVIRPQAHQAAETETTTDNSDERTTDASISGLDSSSDISDLVEVVDVKKPTEDVVEKILTTYGLVAAAV